MSTPGLEAAVIAEACAVVDGRAADTYQTQGQPVPRWAWLNALAHRPPEQLRPLERLAGDPTAQPWGQAVGAIAAHLSRVEPDRVAELQAALFVPLELEALMRAGWPKQPTDVVDALERRLNLGSRGQPPLDGLP